MFIECDLSSEWTTTLCGTVRMSREKTGVAQDVDGCACNEEEPLAVDGGWDHPHGGHNCAECNPGACLAKSALSSSSNK